MDYPPAHKFSPSIHTFGANRIHDIRAEICNKPAIQILWEEY
jgi:hypothetical protein